MSRPFIGIATVMLCVSNCCHAASPDEVAAAMKQSAMYFAGEVAVHGGYVYHYSLDLKQRWGEGKATASQVWVQPPGTPTVGLAFVKAYEATGDRAYLDAATRAAEALVHGQLKSGGWTNSIEFDPRSPLAAEYRNGQGRGKNNSSFDDGQSQSAVRCLMHVDRAHGFTHKAVHESVMIALDAILKAQFANGGFPQVWTGPVSRQPVVKAGYPQHDWRTEGRIKNYWDMYTLNDNVTGYIAELLIDAHEIYDDDRFLAALKKLGDFLVLAQMPEPQPGWAQQYNYDMQPIWARKFEPPGVSGDETQEAVETLMRIVQVTGEEKYLAPIPAALAWLERSQLPDGQVARYYELKSNRPLYMQRQGEVYSLTYDDSNLPDHYGWKTASRVEELQARFLNTRNAVSGDRGAGAREPESVSAADVERILHERDEQGRWISTYAGERLVGQPKFRPGMKYLSSEVFSRNLTMLSEYLMSGRTD